MSNWLKEKMARALLGDKQIYNVYFKGRVQVIINGRPEKNTLEELFSSKGISDLKDIKITKISKVS